MWDFSIRIEQLFRAIEIRLGALQEILEKQERSISEASETGDIHTDKSPRRGVIARIASALESTNADIETYEKPQRKKEYGLQWWSLVPSWITAVATTFAFAAAAYYACVARDQFNQMVIATDTAQKSATTARWALGENQLQFDRTMEQNQKQYSDTLRQMRVQTQATPTVSYRDIFGRPHIVTDCWVYDPSNDDWDGCPNLHQND